jgi:hypothetical protein
MVDKQNESIAYGLTAKQVKILSAIVHSLCGQAWRMRNIEIYFERDVQATTFVGYTGREWKHGCPFGCQIQSFGLFTSMC